MKKRNNFRTLQLKMIYIHCLVLIQRPDLNQSTQPQPGGMLCPSSGGAIGPIFSHINQLGGGETMWLSQRPNLTPILPVTRSITHRSHARHQGDDPRLEMRKP